MVTFSVNGITIDIDDNAYNLAEQYLLETGEPHPADYIKELIASASKPKDEGEEKYQILSGCPLAVEVECAIPKDMLPLYQGILDRIAPGKYNVGSDGTIIHDKATQEAVEIKPAGKLNTARDIEELERVINLTKGCKAVSDATIGDLHVHAGIHHLDPARFGLRKISRGEFRLEVMKQALANYYAATTPQMRADYHLYSPDYDFARSALAEKQEQHGWTEAHFMQEVFKVTSYDALRELICKALPNSIFLWNRNYALNIISYDKYGTLEFRQHEGTVGSQEILKWTNFIDNLMELSIKQAVQYCQEVEHQMPKNITPRMPMEDRDLHHSREFILAAKLVTHPSVRIADATADLFKARHSGQIPL